MPSTEDNKKLSGAAEVPVEGQSTPLDTKLLGQAVIELNISRKSVGIYPPGHVQISRSIDRAYRVLAKLIELWPQLTLGVARDCLFIGEEYLDQKNPVFREFALALHGRDIASVTFLRGLEKDEIVHFHGLLTASSEEIGKAGGVSRMVSGGELAHIRIQVMDYGRFHLTEEEEVFKTESKNRQRDNADLWQAFVSRLISGQLAREGGRGAPLQSWQDIDPSKLAVFLNERRLDPKPVIQSYEEIIASHLRGVIGHQPLEKLNVLLRNLQPELRRQFLSVTFNHIADGGEELLRKFPDDIVLQILQQANDEGREISPTLVALLQKLSNIESTAVHGAQNPRGSGSERFHTGGVAQEYLEKLFSRESYETYVDEDYSSMLTHLSRKHASNVCQAGEFGLEALACDGDGTAGESREEASPVENCSQRFDDDELDLRINRMLFALADREIDGEDYEVFSRRLVANVPDLLTREEFDLALEVLRMLRRHSRERPPGIRQSAQRLLHSFRDSDFIARAVSAFNACSEQNIESGSRFLLALGSSCVSSLVDLCAEDGSAVDKKGMLKLLLSFERETLEDAVIRLDDPREHVVRNLIRLLERLGARDAADHIKPLCAHESHLVRMEALSAMLKFQDPDASGFLRTALHSRVHEEFHHAAMLAGFYQVREVVIDLARMTKRVLFRKSDFLRNEEIIKALGRIGDVNAVPLLEKLARRSWTIFPSHLRHMKLILFESLAGYPREKLFGLLTIGEKSKDYMIRMICEKLSKEQPKDNLVISNS